jgi:DNA-binding GntR family transcriptional regulator
MIQKNPGNTQLKIQTVQEAVVDYLRRQILNGQLKGGQHLVQDELSERLGVSRTPIREALNQLAHEGLVRISTYKGATVADFSPSELIEIYTVRIALESYATYLAAQQITEGQITHLEILMGEMGEAFHQKDFEKLLSAHQDFHTGIYIIAGKERLFELIVRYLELSNVYQRMALSIGRGAKDPIIEHVELLDTLRQKDAEPACKLIRAHLDLTMKELHDLFHEQGGS